LKSYEEFSASVYAKAETRRVRIRQRRSNLRNTALCTAAVITVAAFSGVYTRNRAVPEINDVHVNEVVESEQNARKGGGGDRPQMLVVLKDGGESKARILKRPEDQQALMRQLNPVERDGRISLKEGDAEAKTIYSAQELLDYLAQLRADSLPEMEDYDEAFFAENNLCVMPMDLDTDALYTEETTEDDAAPEELAAEGILPTIPDDTPLGGTEEDAATELDMGEGGPEPTTAQPPFPSAEAGDAGGILKRFVRVFILLPVSKKN